MLQEADQQISALDESLIATHAIVPVGCGSIAQAVTQHFKSQQQPATVVAVEPDTAACLRHSLLAHEMTTVQTEESIMAGLNCGTLSTTAWPVLKIGVDASVVISDLDAHHAVEELEKVGVQAGPCGAASLAALRTVCRDKDKKGALGLGSESVVVLFCTEGRREYAVPTD
jgi:diaminopropionate ammonia-lyase